MKALKNLFKLWAVIWCSMYSDSYYDRLAFKYSCNMFKRATNINGHMAILKDLRSS